jgi:hypothetical protein
MASSSSDYGNLTSDCSYKVLPFGTTNHDVLKRAYITAHRKYMTDFKALSDKEQEISQLCETLQAYILDLIMHLLHDRISSQGTKMIGFSPQYSLYF